MKGRPQIDLTNRRFGNLVVVEQVNPLITNGKKTFRWLCRCDCGKYSIVSKNNLNVSAHTTKSCGECRGTHRVFAKKSPRYLENLWFRIKSFCYNRFDKSYPNYGGRGIKMYEQWRDDIGTFTQWINDNLGSRPSDLVLMRINKEGHYQPGNLQWATKSEQAQNRRLMPSKSKQIDQYDLEGNYLQTFDSIRQAANSTEQIISGARLGQKARSRTQTHANYIWSIRE